MNRREFIMAGVAASIAPRVSLGDEVRKRITVAKASCGFEREPMVRPFGFKGGYLTEEWIVSACVASASGKHGISLDWDAARETTGKAECDAFMQPFASGGFDLRVNLAAFGLDYDKVLKG